MKRSFIVLIVLGFLLSIPMLLWKVEPITQGKVLDKEELNIQDNLKLWAFNSRPFIVVQATPRCHNKQTAFNIVVRLYIDKEIFLLKSQDVICSSSLKNIKVIPELDIPKFQTISKLEIISTSKLENYKVVWYNAQP